MHLKPINPKSLPVREFPPFCLSPTPKDTRIPPQSPQGYSRDYMAAARQSHKFLVGVLTMWVCSIPHRLSKPRHRQ